MKFETDNSRRIAARHEERARNKDKRRELVTHGGHSFYKMPLRELLSADGTEEGTSRCNDVWDDATIDFG